MELPGLDYIFSNPFLFVQANQKMETNRLPVCAADYRQPASLRRFSFSM